VGAILTQNTAWTNVEKAIVNLKKNNLCEAKPLSMIPPERLAPIIKSSGYYNQKARRLICFAHWYLEQGGYQKLFELPSDVLRQALLKVNGIGEETADDIVLYAFQKPYFVIDSYTRRIFSRLGQLAEKEKYQRCQEHFHGALNPDVELFQEYHALIVIHAKRHCLKKPACNGCPLAQQCGYNRITRITDGREKK